MKKCPKSVTKRKMFLAVYYPDTNCQFEWMMELDLDRWFKFVELQNGRIGFTQVDDRGNVVRKV